MTSMITTLAAKLASLRANQQLISEMEKERIPLATILTIFERADWETMQANNWAGFKVLVKTFGPVAIPSYPKQNFPFIFCNWEISKIAEILQTSVHEVGLTLLYNKYPHLKYEASNKPNEGVDK
jgi:hypothetical protein